VKAAACLASCPAATSGRAGVQLARGLAEEALFQCAWQLDLAPGFERFPRSAERAPESFSIDGQNWYWSTSGTTGLVAALLGPTPLAIDAEWLGRERTDALAAYLEPGELALLPHGGTRALLALWSAKEAVIKQTGIGMAAMGRTRLVELLAPDQLCFELDGGRHLVRQTWLPEHVLSVALAAALDDQPPAFEWSSLYQEEAVL